MTAQVYDSLVGNISLEYQFCQITSIFTIIPISSCMALKNQCIIKCSVFYILNIYIFILFKLFTQYFTGTYSQSNGTCIGIIYYLCDPFSLFCKGHISAG